MNKNYHPAKIQDFRKGILTRDLNKVREALDAGIDPATPMRDGQHPLGVLLYHPPMQDISTPAAQALKTDYNKKTSEVVDLLLERGVRLLEPEKYASEHCPFLVDRLLFSDRLDDVSNIVIHAIYEGCSRQGQLYDFNLEGMINNFASANYDLLRGDRVLIASQAMLQAETVHDIVRARLQSPQTAIEEKLVAEYGDDLDYWMSDMERVPLDIAVEYMEVPEQNGTFLSPQANGGNPPQGAKAQKEKESENPYEKMIKHLPKKEPAKIMAEVEALEGMEEAKSAFRKFTRFVQYEAALKEMGVPVENDRTLHSVFFGDPGTGKTTLARHYAEMLYTLGLAGPKFLEVTRENLTGKYMGFTENNVLEAFAAADQIFVDETYSLYNPDSKVDYGNTIVNALIPILENQRATKVVSMAGYKEKMDEFINKANPGLRSRIGYFMDVKRPTLDNLMNDFDRRIGEYKFSITPEAHALVKEQLASAQASIAPENFGNYRIVRTVAQKLREEVGNRVMDPKKMTGIAVDKKTFTTITEEDVKALDIAGKICGAEMGAPSLKSSGRGIGFLAKI